MKTSTSALLAVTSVTYVAAQFDCNNPDIACPDTQEWFDQLPQPLVDCDADFRPEWEDCQSTIDYWFGDKEDWNTDTIHTNGEDGLPTPSCRWWFWEDGNCRITHCFTDQAPAGDKAIYAYFKKDYNAIRDRCQTFRAGGFVTEIGGDFRNFLEVTNDEDSNGEGEVSGDPAKVKLRPRLSENGFQTGDLTLEEYEEWAAHRKPSREKTTENKDNVRSKAKSKRDDDDDDYLILFTAKNVRQPGVYDRGPRMSPGVGYTYTKTEGYSVTTSVSAEIGGAFKMFTAGISSSVEETESVEVSESMKYDVPCNNGQTGQVHWHPLFDFYEVEFFPSGTIAEIWLPVKGSDDFAAGEFAINCLG
ncbi:hypothetical protein BN1723_008973 [Verticillium longisporum]|uniref:Uncharacterized protein n=1 Tax=Verticillium longisporum TaxID=100787 RepID=A0A0G4KLL4_VERLO|nr:hypothetical protein HYQ44_010934 [Verticillium longisporum]CRK07936.1 hypothetical protein BN1723_008973 [Verticillium longisporum]CRK36700.1 hypothetical protein BN1708_007142 [Verticillium longisporum]